MLCELILKAKKEKIFEIDISDKVMKKIKDTNIANPFFSFKSMKIFVVTSAVAASILIFCAIHSYSIYNNPIIEFYNPIEIESYYNF